MSASRRTAVIPLVVLAIGRWIFLDRQRAKAIDAVFASPVRQENLTIAVAPKRDNRGED